MSKGVIMLHLPNELAQKILNYLAVRPYNEVHQFIPALMQLKEVEDNVQNPS